MVTRNAAGKFGHCSRRSSACADQKHFWDAIALQSLLPPEARPKPSGP
jgi:hypothetical protein